MEDPIHQFEIVKYFTLGHIAGREIAFTNSALFMAIAIAGITLLLVGSTSRRSLVPGRLQSIAEMSYEFVADMVRSTTGTEGMRFFPFVFSIFMFVLFLNLIGLVPYTFSVTSHIVITATLALMVFFTVIGYGVWKNGTKFLRVFVPSGIPIYILPLVSAIEVMSFLSRPLSHCVRLFANMLAGHITLKVFAGFIGLLGAWGFLGWLGAILPLGLTVALTALELLVAVLQAYVFAILTCISLHDAIHPGHSRPITPAKPERIFPWTQPPRNSSALVSPASAWAAPASAWARSSACICPQRCATRPPRRASSAT